MVKVDWTPFKTFVDDRGLSIQWIDYSTHYQLWAYDGPMAMECILIQDGTSESVFESDYKATGNRSPSQRTRSERADISMRLCCNAGVADGNGDVTVEFRVPGTFGTDPGREIAGGNAFWAAPAAGNRITHVEVVDKDNVLGAGAGYVVKPWHDSDITSYQVSGWYMSNQQPLQLTSMGDWGQLPSGLYLRLKAVGTASDTLYINLIWGEPT